MFKQTLAKHKPHIRIYTSLAVISILTAGFLLHPLASADRFEQQIAAIRQENAQKQENKNRLSTEAVSLSDAIAKLQSQIDALQKQISDNQQKNKELQRQIAEAEAELARQRKLLGQNIKAMYLEGQISTIEMLASSKDLSEYMDKQQYRDSVKDKIKSTLEKITLMKTELQEQKTQLEKLINDQKAMQLQIDAQREEQARILSMNQSQQAELDAQIKANNAEISELRQQQIIENARLFNGAKVVLGTACDTANGDTYPSPWCSAPIDYYVDTWGMFSRQCVSYTAWKVAESGRHMPYWGGIGNANQWDDNAFRFGIPADNIPRAGDVAIKNSGYYGHAMYVESVNPDGTINISQYNANWDGRYSRVYNMSPAGLVFIHFP